MPATASSYDSLLDAEVVSATSPSSLLIELAKRVGPDDALIKVAGAGGAGDWLLEYDALHLAISSGAAAFHANGDCAISIPYWARNGGVRPALLAMYDGILVLNGGDRAVTAYRTLAPGVPVYGGDMAICLGGLPDKATWGAAHDHARTWDFLVVVGASSSREGRMTRLLCGLCHLAVAVAGDPTWIPDRLAREITVLGPLSAANYQRILMDTDHVLNLVRPEAFLLQRCAPCRIYEAAAGGAVVVSEWFPGVEEVLAPMGAAHIIPANARHVASLSTIGRGSAVLRRQMTMRLEHELRLKYNRLRQEISLWLKLVSLNRDRKLRCLPSRDEYCALSLPARGELWVSMDASHSALEVVTTKFLGLRSRRTNDESLTAAASRYSYLLISAHEHGRLTQWLARHRAQAKAIFVDDINDKHPLMYLSGRDWLVGSLSADGVHT